MCEVIYILKSTSIGWENDIWMSFFVFVPFFLLIILWITRESIYTLVDKPYSGEPQVPPQALPNPDEAPEETKKKISRLKILFVIVTLCSACGFLLLYFGCFDVMTFSYALSLCVAFLGGGLAESIAAEFVRMNPHPIDIFLWLRFREIIDTAEMCVMLRWFGIPPEVFLGTHGMWGLMGHNGHTLATEIASHFKNVHLINTLIDASTIAVSATGAEFTNIKIVSMLEVANLEFVARILTISENPFIIYGPDMLVVEMINEPHSIHLLIALADSFNCFQGDGLEVFIHDIQQMSDAERSALVPVLYAFCMESILDMLIGSMVF